MNTATFIKDIEKWRGHASLYKLDPPMKDFEGEKAYEHVIVSAVVAPMSGPETYIFPAKPNGEVIDFGELPGSQRDTMSHDCVLQDAGYTVVRAAA